MEIKHITFSDPKEHNLITEIESLLGISPRVEIGVQVHDGDLNKGLPRYDWLEEICAKSSAAKIPLNVALHINYQWCEDICNGKIAPELQKWIDAKNTNASSATFRRLQLNFGDFSTNKINANKISDVINKHSNHKFIIPYNEKNHGIVHDLYKLRNDFQILFDASYGIGKSPENWGAPVFANVFQGYAGGLGPINVSDELDKINKVVPQELDVWIDAEGKLMEPGTRKLSILKAKEYINQSILWNLKNGHHRNRCM